MKKSFRNLSLFGVVAGMVAFTSCSDSILPGVEDAELKSVSIKDVGGNDIGSSVTLFAGQNIDAGLLHLDDVDTDGDGQDDVLKVTYELKNNWELENIHFWIGRTLAEMPQTKTGSPKLGHFPYSYVVAAGQTSYEFSIPLSSIGFTCENGKYLVAANAGIRLPLGGGTYQREGAWGDGLRILQKGSWAEYFNIDITCDPTAGTEPESASETAWAHSAQYAKTFTSITGTPRWGWTNGPLAEGTHTLDLVAAAGKNDLSKGTRVGSVVVVYSNGTAVVTYNVTAPYKLEEAQLYVGNDLLAKDNGDFTIAPGQLGNNAGDLNSVSTYTFTVSGLSGTVHVQAHATVSGF